MSALIHHFVVHRLVVNQQQELAVVPRHECFAVSPQIEALAQQINQAFNTKPGKGVGGFIEHMEGDAATASDAEDMQKDVSQFHALLKDMATEPSSFVDFSVKSCELLKKSLVETGTVETGFVIFSHYEFLATQYLMIALINTKEHVEISSDLELSYSDHLDLAKMQLAVRIDLTQLDISPEQNRYISFIKGRMGRKVSDFFMRFVGCQELVDIKQQNKQLISSVDDYLSSSQLDAEEKQQSREIVADYYKEKLELGDDIELKELAKKLPSEGSGDDFYQFNQQNQVPLEDNFQADRTVLKNLAKFTGQGGGVSVSFDRKLYGERIVYHPETDTLVIKGIPPNLKDQLTKVKGD